MREIKNDKTGSMNQVGMISNHNLCVLSSEKYIAGAETASTVDWLVDCGIPKIFAINREIATENKIIDTRVNDIRSGSRISLPRVVEVCFPATNAPIKTIMPKSPGMAVFLTIFAPKATENAGPVPLPPMLRARNMAIKNGISIMLKIPSIRQNYLTAMLIIFFRGILKNFEQTRGFIP
jgi:hypothetical protein